MGPRGAAAVALVLTALLVGVAGCGAAGPSSVGPGSAAASGLGSASTPLAAASGVTAVPSPASLLPGPATLAVDPSLLALLPTTIDGLSLDAAPDAAAEIAADPSLGGSASAVAVGIAIASADPAATGIPSTDDFAVVTLVKLRPGTFSEAFFRDWRDSHDVTACAPAGGIMGHAQATLGDRPTFIATCRQGVRIHHVHLVEPDVLVAVTSLGDRRLGERLVAAIPAAIPDPSGSSSAAPGSGGSAVPTMTP